jgi:peptidyl-prolyl cis-trans isomerase D
VKALGLTATRAEVTEGQPLVVNGAQIPSVSAWAFGGAKPGETSDLYDDDQGYYLARLESVTPGGVPSLDQAKGEIRTLLARRKAVQAEVDAARKLATAAAGSSLEQAGRILNTPVVKSPPFTRLTGIPQLPDANKVVGAAFALPVGQVSAPIATDEAVYVIRVDNRTLADRKAWEAQKDDERRQAMQSMQQGRIQEFMASLRAAAKITDRRKEIAAALQHSNS